jgi:hypothetical protein
VAAVAQPLVPQLTRRVIEVDEQRPGDQRPQRAPAPAPQQQPEREVRRLVEQPDDRPARLQRPPQRVGRQRERGERRS